MKKVIFIIAFLFFFSGLIFAKRLPSYKELCKCLKDIPGWKAKACSGMNLYQSSVGNVVTAQRIYVKGNKEVTAMIIYGEKIQSFWVPFQYNMQMENPEEFVKITTINGFKVGIEHFKKESSGDVVILLAKSLSDTPAGIVFSYTNMNWKEALNFAKKFDWNKIKSFF